MGRPMECRSAMELVKIARQPHSYLPYLVYLCQVDYFAQSTTALSANHAEEIITNPLHPAE